MSLYHLHTHICVIIKCNLPPYLSFVHDIHLSRASCLVSELHILVFEFVTRYQRRESHSPRVRPGYIAVNDNILYREQKVLISVTPAHRNRSIFEITFQHGDKNLRKVILVIIFF